MASPNDRTEGKQGSGGRPSGSSEAPDRPRKKTVKKAGRKARPSSLRDRRAILLPLLTVWLMAMVTLAGLIYWSDSSTERSFDPSKYARVSGDPKQPSKPASDSKQVESRSGSRYSEPLAGAWKRPDPREAAPSLPAPEKGAPPSGQAQEKRPPAGSLASSQNEQNSKPPASPPDANGEKLPARQADRSAHASSAPPNRSATPPHESQPAPQNSASTASAAAKGENEPPPEPDRKPQASSATASRSAEQPQTPPPEQSAQPQTASANRSVERSASADEARQNGRMTVASVSKSFERAPIPKPDRTPPVDATLARVAIVIDDFGKSAEIARKFLTIPLALTFSVLPFEAHSKEVAELAHANNREVLLHAPMEPKGYPKVNPGRGALLLSMSENAVRKELGTALDLIPHVSGVNNHMGSSFTESSGRMKIVLTEIRSRSLYFLDSFTTPNSAGAAVAGDLGMPRMQRDVFLDHTVSERFVLSQIKSLIRQAKIQGSAVAIGHPHEATFNALMQEAETFKREGVAVVPAGELARAAASGSR